MNPDDSFIEPQPQLKRTRIEAGEARVAVFQRVYDAAIEDVWDACTNPERLRRWYVPVSGELHVGGTFAQPPMGTGTIVRCDAPHHLKLSLGDGQDEIELHLSVRADGSTALELRHATTLDSHEIGGRTYDAIFCMGGGYYPRLHALDRHLRGTLPGDYDPLAFHEDPRIRPIIDRGSAAMAALLAAEGDTAKANVTAVDYVGISVRDLEAAKLWYAMVLGFESDCAWGKFGAEFQVGGTTIALMQKDRIGSEHTPNATALALRVDDVAAERTRLEGEGVTFSDQFDSGVCHQAVFQDPDGNVLVLHHRYAPR